MPFGDNGARTQILQLRIPKTPHKSDEVRKCCLVRPTYVVLVSKALTTTYNIALRLFFLACFVTPAKRFIYLGPSRTLVSRRAG